MTISKGFPIRHLTKAGLSCFLLLCICSCAPRQRNGHTLFALDSLIHAQASQLTKRQATLSKEIVLRSKRETINIAPPDTVAWLKELEAFGVIDAINKPVNRDHYQITEDRDSRSNLRVRSFVTADDLPVSFVRIYFYRQPANIRRMEANYSVHNGLYKTQRSLTMAFDDVNGTPVMTSYTISGNQKMLMDDTVRYDISGRVTLVTK